MTAEPSVPRQPTEVCLLTPSGRGAVAVVGVSGPDALKLVSGHFRAASSKSFEAGKTDRPYYGLWQSEHSSTVEDLIVWVRSRERVEVHCHGGAVAWRRIQADLVDSGAVSTRWQESSWAQVDSSSRKVALELLPQALTAKASAALWDQSQGALERTGCKSSIP